MSDDNRKEQPAEMSPEFRAWHESIPKLTLGGAKGAAPKAPLNEHVWIGYCDLCNGQHCVTIEKADANVTRRPHSDSLARAHAEGLEAGLRQAAEYVEGTVVVSKTAIAGGIRSLIPGPGVPASPEVWVSLVDWEAVTEDQIKMLNSRIPGGAIVDEVHAVVRKHRKYSPPAPAPAAGREGEG